MRGALAHQFTASGAPANRRRTGTPALPPMPDAPSRCRWCRGRRLLILDSYVCPNGCAANEHAAFLADCSECRRPFQTGRRVLDAVLCHECEEQELKAIDLAEGSPDVIRARHQMEDEAFDRAEAGDRVERRKELQRRHGNWRMQHPGIERRVGGER